jgi:hypothetical protein
MWPFNKQSHRSNGFLDLEEVSVPRRVADEAQAHLRAVGENGFEGFALWAGVRSGQSFFVKEAIIPAQSGYRSAEGVCVYVGPEELHRINVWLYEHEMTLIGQLHSHPEEAFHSDTDDTFPIATTLGALSLVLPNYARRPFVLAECAIYRLMPTTGWTPMSRRAAARLISVTD